jgi:hypothetical protein
MPLYKKAFEDKARKDKELQERAAFNLKKLPDLEMPADLQPPQYRDPEPVQEIPVPTMQQPPVQTYPQPLLREEPKGLQYEDILESLNDVFLQEEPEQREEHVIDLLRRLLRMYPRHTAAILAYNLFVELSGWKHDQEETPSPM